MWSDLLARGFECREYDFFLLFGYMGVEWWLGKTNKVRAGSVIELVTLTAAFLMGAILGGLLNGSKGNKRD